MPEIVSTPGIFVLVRVSIMLRIMRPSTMSPTNGMRKSPIVLIGVDIPDNARESNSSPVKLMLMADGAVSTQGINKKANSMAIAHTKASESANEIFFFGV